MWNQKPAAARSIESKQRRVVMAPNIVSLAGSHVCDFFTGIGLDRALILISVFLSESTDGAHIALSGHTPRQAAPLSRHLGAT